MDDNLLIELRGLELRLQFLKEKNNDIEDNIKKILTIILTITTFVFVIVALVFNRIDVDEMPSGSIQIYIYGFFVMLTNVIIFCFIIYIVRALSFLKGQTFGYKPVQVKDDEINVRLPLSLDFSSIHSISKDNSEIYIDSLNKEIAYLGFSYGENSLKYKNFNKISSVYLILLLGLLSICTFMFIFI